MLKTQSWMKYALDMVTEWQQLLDEGRDVASFETRCRELQKRAETEDCEKDAVALYNEMAAAPLRPDFDYEEPSDWEGIQKLVKGNSPCSVKLTENELKDKIAGAWIGRIGGCLLGKPFEGMRTPEISAILTSTENSPMTRYADSREFPEDIEARTNDKFVRDRTWIDRITRAATPDDDTNYTVLAMKLIETYGRDFAPDDVLEAWLRWMPMFAACTAERVAYRNAAMGLYAPETATERNPFREWIGAQIRGDFFGYINPDDTKTAASMAWRDGCISHIKNGIYGEMWVSAMIARAAVSGDVLDVIEAGLNEIPPRSRLTEGVRKIMEMHASGAAAKEAFDCIHTVYDEYDGHHWCHTISNAMIVTACLLYGEKDFGRTVCMAVETGFDTDCNAATAGSVLGMMLGEKNIPAYWWECFHRRLMTSIDGYNEVSLEELTEKTVSLMKK